MPFLTAWLPLTRQASLRPGTRVLVTAAAGGVGSAAVQVVRALGAQGVRRRRLGREAEVPRSLGADPVVTYDRLDEVGRVDVVFDPVGGEFTRALGLLKPLGTAIAVGFAGGLWEPLEVQRLVGRNSAVAGFYLGRMMQLEPETVRVAAGDVLRLWEQGAVHPVVGAKFPLVQAAAALDFMESAVDRKGGLDPVMALVTGSAGGLGRAIVARLRAEGYDVQELDLTTGFDVTDPAAWEEVGPVDLACLNAGVLTGRGRRRGADARAVPPRGRGQRRRRGARRAPARAGDGARLRDRRHGLARRARRGPGGPVYGLTKFAVVGFVRSAAPQLAARGIRLNALCPSWADTPLVPDELRGASTSAAGACSSPRAWPRGVWPPRGARATARRGSSRSVASRSPSSTGSSRAAVRVQRLRGQRVDREASHARLEVQVRAGGVPGRADEADGRAGGDRGAEHRRDRDRCA